MQMVSNRQKILNNILNDINTKSKEQRQQELYDELGEDAKIMKYINDTIDEIRREKRNTK